MSEKRMNEAKTKKHDMKKEQIKRKRGQKTGLCYAVFI